MIHFGTSLAGIERFLLNALYTANQSSNQSALRLALGTKYNTPSDDPSAYLTISKLENRLSHVKTTLAQVNAAASIAAQAQQTLDEIHTQIDLIRSTLETDEDQSLTAEERAAAQATIDTALEHINSLAATEINGRRILDGSAYFDVSGMNTAQVLGLNVISVNGSSATVSGTVTAAATQGSRVYNGLGNKTTAAATFTLTGSFGSYTFSVVNNQFLSTVETDINQYSAETGVTAVASGSNLTFSTVDYGSDASVTIDVTSGTFATAGTGVGTDATATINGASLTGVGNAFHVSNSSGHYILSFQGGFSGAFSAITVNNNRALRFALTTDITRITKLNLHGAFTADFRGVYGSLDQLASGGSLDGLGSITGQALLVVDEALSQLELMEAKVESFADESVASSAALLGGLQTELEDSIQSMNGVNEDEENLNILRNDALASYAAAGLTLLQQQQAGLLAVLQKLAGLK